MPNEPAATPPPDPAQASTGELIGQLSDQLSRLVPLSAESRERLILGLLGTRTEQMPFADGRLALGKTYSVAKVIGAGANAKIKKYKLAGPGQHVDGIEQWFYPLQPPS